MPGLPKAHLSYVHNIKEGLPLFLFNYDDRRLHGVYEAASNGKFCPESNAWTNNGYEKTSYPAQVSSFTLVYATLLNLDKMTQREHCTLPII